MGQFKPMVKMYTTEPSVELKLKKGGHVSSKHSKGSEHGHKSMHMMDGGIPRGMPTRPLRPAAPANPALAARRRAMMAMPAGAAPAGPVGMAGRMMKDGGESKAEHKAEMKKFSKLEGELKSHEGKPASKAHRGLKTGGVVMGQGGFKEGGIIKSTSGETRMVTAKPDHSPANTGGVKMGNGGGYKKGGMAKYAEGGSVNWENRPADTAKAGPTGTTTGGVRKGNGGGFKKGGAAKKAFATGGVVDSGHPVAMPKKPPSKPVSINQLSGTFKKGGSVKC